MDLLDRLLGHDAWTTGELLKICAPPEEEQLDREFDIGHRTIQRTLRHLIHNMEAWTGMMAGVPQDVNEDDTIPGLMRRLEIAETRLREVSHRVSEAGAWDELWYDTLEDPPRHKSYGASIAHLITHSMHHRAQVLYMLRLSGVENLPEGDVFTWAAA